MIEILNICLHQNSIVIKFFKILKIREIFCENPRIIFVLFYNVHKENMFTTNLEDEREAPSKARKKGAKRLEFLVKNIFHSVALSKMRTAICCIQNCQRYFDLFNKAKLSDSGQDHSYLRIEIQKSRPHF